MNTANHSLLIVEDDIVFSTTLARALQTKGFDVHCASNLSEAFEKMNVCEFMFAILDLRLNDESGLKLIPELLEQNSETRIVVLTGYASIATAVEAIKLGAIHYLTKPVGTDEIYQAFFKEEGDFSLPVTDSMSIKRIEWEHIQKVLVEHQGNVSATARSLGMHRRTLQRKLQKYPTRS